MKRHALFVGVENYEDHEIQDLHYCIDDAVKMSSLFDRLGFKTRILRNESQNVVLRTIEKLTCDLHAGDMFLMFFSGHGFSVGGEDLIFCPEDRCCDLRCGNSAGLSHAKIKARTVSQGDQFDRIFIFDTCRSFLAGTKGESVNEMIIRNDGSKVGTKDLCPSVTFTEDVSGSVYFLRSCCSGEQSLELPDIDDEDVGNGLFTRALLSILERQSNDRQPIFLNGDFCEDLRKNMDLIKMERHCNWVQTPETSIAGRPLCLWMPDGWNDWGVDGAVKKRREEENERRMRREKSNQEKQDEIEKALDEAIRHMQFLCGSATVDLTQNRTNVEVREKLGEVFRVFYDLDRNREPEGRSDLYDIAEIERMEDACENLFQFLQMRRRANCPVWLARECKASVRQSAESLRNTRRYDKLAELMLKCVCDPATRLRR